MSVLRNYRKAAIASAVVIASGFGLVTNSSAQQPEHAAQETSVQIAFSEVSLTKLHDIAKARILARKIAQSNFPSFDLLIIDEALKKANLSYETLFWEGSKARTKKLVEKFHADAVDSLIKEARHYSDSAAEVRDIHGVMGENECNAFIDLTARALGKASKHNELLGRGKIGWEALDRTGTKTRTEALDDFLIKLGACEKKDPLHPAPTPIPPNANHKING